MAIRIELTPAEEARLRERAEQRGEQPESVAGEMLRALLLPTANGASTKLVQVVDDAHVNPGGRRLCGVWVPGELEYLAEVIQRSMWMLGLDSDWDGQDSPAYASETWERAGSLLLNGAVEYFGRFDERIPPPAFENGPEGSIDILWETNDRELLLNVPVDTDAPVRYFGRSSGGGFEVKGTVAPAEQRRWFPLLVQWLLE